MNPIGLVTCYFHHNYGSMLQAYATEMIMQRMGLPYQTIACKAPIDYMQGSRLLYIVKRLLIGDWKMRLGKMKIEKAKRADPVFARNTAVAEATGEFIMHVDSDDYVDEHIVEKAMCKQQENDADIVVIDFLQAHPAFTVSRHYLSFAQPKDYCIDVLARKSTNSIWAKLIRRSLYTDNGIACKEGCNQGEDFQVVPILLYNAKRIVNLHEALYYYDCSNGGSYSNNFSISKHEQNWESMDIVRDYFKDKGEEYVEAVNCGRIRQLVDDLIISAKISGEVANYYYSYAVKELGHTGKKYRIAVSKQKRSILLFVRYYWLMRSYILVLRGVRYFFLKYLYCGKRDL